MPAVRETAQVVIVKTPTFEMVCPTQLELNVENSCVLTSDVFSDMTSATYSVGSAYQGNLTKTAPLPGLLSINLVDVYYNTFNLLA